jgi:DNA-binding NarL/FixJ family response regulator
MTAYTIHLTSGEQVVLHGNSFEVDPELGTVVLRGGAETYTFFKDAILYWSEAGTLTVRQLDILKSMAEGKTNASIARDLAFSESTVRQEAMAIYRSLGVTTREDATRVGYETGVLDDEDPAH